MKIRKLLSSLFFSGLVSLAFSSCSLGATDFNEVGKEMSRVLQNAHFERLNKEFNDNLSKDIFDTYIKELDGARIFFTQEDINALSKKYATEIDDYILADQTMIPALDIYNLFLTRVKERMDFAQKVLKENKFSFNKDISVERLRKNAAWPKNKKAADELWRNRLEEQVLSEILRKETISKLAKEQGKPDPSAKEKAPTERVKLRYDRVLRNFKEVDNEDIANYFLSAVTHAYDPHTDYMSARETEQFKSSMKGTLTGIGALLGEEDDGSVKINGIVVGGPADKSGLLKLNDRIVAVDSNNDGEMTDILFMKIDKVIDLIRGPKDTVMRMKVESADAPGQAKIVTLTRAEVELKDELAKAEIIETKDANGKPKRLGLIILPSFYFDMEGGERRCATDIERLLKRLKEEKVEGLVLDLRRNGGGSLEEVRRMTGFFVGGGPVVQIKDTRGKVQVSYADAKPAIFTEPMVVLIDKLSASASEILAGALQDYGRAVIVGDVSTFGKGTVQQPLDMARFLPYASDRSRAGALKLTTQKFYRVSGGSTQHRGVLADIILPTPSAAFEVGESILDFPLPYDEIAKSSNYKKDAALTKALPALKKRSGERLKSDADLQTMQREIDRTKLKIAENRLSLSKEVREKELAEQEAWRKEVLADRKKRFPQIEENDKKKWNIYRLTLEDLDSKELKLSDWKKDKDSTMKIAKDETDALDESPEIPSGLDAETREALNILTDMIQAETP